LHRYCFLADHQNFDKPTLRPIQHIVEGAYLIDPQPILRPLIALKSLDATFAFLFRLLTQVDFDSIQHFCPLMRAQGQQIFFGLW